MGGRILQPIQRGAKVIRNGSLMPRTTCKLTVVVANHQQETQLPLACSPSHSGESSQTSRGHLPLNRLHELRAIDKLQLRPLAAVLYRSDVGCSKVVVRLGVTGTG